MGHSGCDCKAVLTADECHNLLCSDYFFFLFTMRFSGLNNLLVEVFLILVYYYYVYLLLFVNLTFNDLLFFNYQLSDYCLPMRQIFSRCRQTCCLVTDLSSR